jgi:phosphoribosylaminoimidazolecarboxamide formyltransferase/IMP cyclohydrolase
MAERPIRRALLSVYDKTGIVELATFLRDRGVELISTGGTYRALAGAGLPVVEVADYTGFPEMMDGRVKTLHPRIHGGLLCRRDDEDHLAQAAAQGIGLIDLVVVNLYPFEATCDRRDASAAEKVEQIDIGGPSMLRSAAKNHAAVTVVVRPADYPRLREEMTAYDGATTLAFRQACARTVFRTTARYDALIAEELTRLAGDAAADERFPDEWAIPLRKVQALKYGENPHQAAAFYALRLPGSASLTGARQIHGEELGYCNLMDADGAWELVKEFTEPACAIIKHANPCGCAVAGDLATAFARAWAGDPQAAFGSVIACNRELDAATAAAMAGQVLIHIILAPGFEPAAREILTTRPKWRRTIRLLEVDRPAPVPAGTRYFKNIFGGLLVQDLDGAGWESDRNRVVTRRAPTAAELRDLEVAWLVVKHLKSNAICLVKDRALVGPGCGQMSRVTASELAVKLAGPERARGAVLGSDAYFPFPDGVEAAAAAGVTAIIQPGGSKGDDAVIAEADRRGLAMIFTGTRHFRH